MKLGYRHVLYSVNYFELLKSIKIICDNFYDFITWSHKFKVIVIKHFEDFEILSLGEDSSPQDTFKEA